MRLVERKVGLNRDTFEPELVLTVALPIELMNDDIKPGDDTMAFEKISNEFINIIKSLGDKE
jgi:hypothetical protein